MQGYAVAVDERAGPTVSADHAAQDALAIEVQHLFFEPLPGFGQVREVEFRRELGAFRIRPDESSASTLAENQSHGVHEYRFAGARFAGEHGQARRELDFYLVDDRKISDLDTG